MSADLRSLARDALTSPFGGILLHPWPHVLGAKHLGRCPSAGMGQVVHDVERLASQARRKIRANDPIGELAKYR